MRLLFVAASCLFSVSAWSTALPEEDFSQCRQFFASETSPVFVKPLPYPAIPVCLSSYAVLYSPGAQAPLFTVERIRPGKSGIAPVPLQLDTSDIDTRDYKKQGFMPGQLAVGTKYSKKHPDFKSAFNQFPHDAANKQDMWQGIDDITQKYLAQAKGDVYIMTGLLFRDKPKTIGQNKAWVPHILYKLVYDANRKTAWAFWASNSGHAPTHKPITYRELVKRTGIEFLPLDAASLKD